MIHTFSYILFRYINLTTGGKSLEEVKLRKQRNLFVCVSEELEDGEYGDGEGPVWSHKRQK